MSDASGERSQKATQKRLKEVYREGKLQRSTDLTAWIGIGAAAAALAVVMSNAAAAVQSQLRAGMTIVAHPTAGAALQLLGNALGNVVPTVAVLLVVSVVAVVAGALVPNGLHFRRLKPHLEQFNLASGLGRLFGGQAWWNGLKSLLKVIVVGAAFAIVANTLVPALLGGGVQSLGAMLATAQLGMNWLMWTAVAAGLGLGVADIAVVARKNRKHTMMSMKELKDEAKNTEGDPLIRQQRRSRALAISRNRMIRVIADADVVLVNPTEYAVALRYEPGKSAPRVVAKGRGIIAARIREEAVAKDVPMVKNIPLARTLHAVCDLGQEIPPELYTAVAIVLTFVAALRRGGRDLDGVHELAKPIDVPDASQIARRRKRIRR